MGGKWACAECEYIVRRDDREREKRVNGNRNLDITSPKLHCYVVFRLHVIVVTILSLLWVPSPLSPPFTSQKNLTLLSVSNKWLWIPCLFTLKNNFIINDDIYRSHSLASSGRGEREGEKLHKKRDNHDFEWYDISDITESSLKYYTWSVWQGWVAHRRLWLLAFSPSSSYIFFVFFCRLPLEMSYNDMT